ncbi:MAG: hypothetical protein EOO89_21925, partial [Pedobacter sp.]
MTTTRIRNNTGGLTIHVDRQGSVTIQGQYTVLSTTSESVTEDAPTNSMSAQAIAGGNAGDQPPI